MQRYRRRYSEENIDRIFEPFFTTKKHSGTGLGLYLTYYEIQKAGGEITVTSELNKGTLFEFFIPGPHLIRDNV